MTTDIRNPRINGPTSSIFLYRFLIASSAVSELVLCPIQDQRKSDNHVKDMIDVAVLQAKKEIVLGGAMFR